MPEHGYSFLICFVTAFAVMALAFVIARRIERYDFLDVAWGCSFIAMAVATFVIQPGHWIELDGQAVATFAVILWGLRLSQHLFRRIILTSEEDHRYTDRQQRWRGNVAANVFVRLYTVRAVLATLIFTPVIFLNASPDERMDFGVIVGLVMWLIGFVIEAEADRQLQRFRHKNRGSNLILQTGFWAHSRHPNYFGELLQWWGIYVIACGVPYGWLSFVGPLLLTIMIFFVTGIPLVEKSMATKKGWQHYRQATRLLVPLPKR